MPASEREASAVVVTLPLPLGDAVVEALRHCDGDGVGEGDGESVA